MNMHVTRSVTVSRPVAEKQGYNRSDLRCCTLEYPLGPPKVLSLAVTVGQRRPLSVTLPVVGVGEVAPARQ